MKKKVFISLIIAIPIIAGIIFVALFLPEAGETYADISELGLPFSEENRNNYIVDIHAHSWGTDDGVHFAPTEYNNADKYITFYAPVKCKVTSLLFTTMKNNNEGEADKYCVKIGLKINDDYYIDLSVETFSNDPTIGQMQSAATYVELNQWLNKGDRVVTLISNVLSAHICYSINYLNTKHNPIDFMTQDDIDVFAQN